jgi:hypothetical protein
LLNLLTDPAFALLAMGGDTELQINCWEGTSLDVSATGMVAHALAKLTWLLVTLLVTPIDPTAGDPTTSTRVTQSPKLPDMSLT